MNMKNERAIEILKIIEHKIEAVNKTLEAVNKQIDCFEDGVLDEEYFEEQQEKIDEYIARVDQWNERFAEIIPEAQVQLEQLKKEDSELTEKIYHKVKELDVVSEDLKSAETSLRGLFEQYIAGEYKKMRERNALNKKAAVYYNNMLGQMDRESYFYDQKN